MDENEQQTECASHFFEYNDRVARDRGEIVRRFLGKVVLYR